MKDYDKQWYDRYRKYLQEPGVRQTHDSMFRMFVGFVNSHISLIPHDGRRKGLHEIRDAGIIDLGCATMEYYRYSPWCGDYFGLDNKYLETEYDDIGDGDRVEVGKLIEDYRRVNLSEIGPFKPDGFISLFSTEIFMSACDKYEFYSRIFRENTSIEFGMVAGFYYKGFEDSETYEEDHGFVFQTIENQRDHQSKLFNEFRTYVDVPPGMFKDEFVEVWKFFRRKI